MTTTHSPTSTRSPRPGRARRARRRLGGVGATVAVTVAVWATLALLERLTGLATRIWTSFAVAVLVASMIPIFLVDATPGTQIALFAVHLAAAVLVPALLRAR